MSTKENVEVVESSSDNTTLKDKLIHLMKQFFSFLLVSGVGWVMDFTIFLILTNVFGLWVMISNMISAIPAITYVFLMSNKKIFKNENSKLDIKWKYVIYFVYQIIVLVTVSAIGQVLYDWFITLFTWSLIVNNLKLIVKILITPITMCLNFIVMKNLVERL